MGVVVARLWRLEGGAAQVKGASNHQNKFAEPQKQEGCSKLNWYSTQAK